MYIFFSTYFSFLVHSSHKQPCYKTDVVFEYIWFRIDRLSNTVSDLDIGIAKYSVQPMSARCVWLADFSYGSESNLAQALQSEQIVSHKHPGPAMTNKHNKKPKKSKLNYSRQINDLAEDMAQLKSIIKELRPYKRFRLVNSTLLIVQWSVILLAPNWRRKMWMLGL